MNEIMAYVCIKKKKEVEVKKCERTVKLKKGK
jgi:hypothetical protein